MRILYVEDHRVFADTVSGAFLQEHEVCVVGTTTEATSMDLSTFAVALVDYDLPDGKGDVVVRWIRSKSQSLPIVAVSSHAAGNEALRAAGADAVCGKSEFSRIRTLLSELRGARVRPS